MYYALGLYPRLDKDLSESIDAIRADYDPTSGLVGPHITVLFPVPADVGQEKLVRHIRGVVSTRAPFEIRLGGFRKSRDHWLFLTLEEGEEEVKSMHQDLYTGILAGFRKVDAQFIPHLGLGLFIRQGCTYDWNDPRESDFDRERYEEALCRAKELPLASSSRLDKAHMTGIPDAVLEWATGKRATIPEGARITELREFRLGERGGEGP